MTVEKHYSLQSAAKLLDVSERFLLREIHEGRLHAVDLTPDAKKRMWRIPVSALQAFGLSVTDEETTED